MADASECASLWRPTAVALPETAARAWEAGVTWSVNRAAGCLGSGCTRVAPSCVHPHGWRRPSYERLPHEVLHGFLPSWRGINQARRGLRRGGPAAPCGCGRGAAPRRVSRASLLRLLRQLVGPADLILQLLILPRELADLSLQAVHGALPPPLLLPQLVLQLLGPLLQPPPLLEHLSVLRQLLPLALGTLAQAPALLLERCPLGIELCVKGPALGLDLLPQPLALPYGVTLSLRRPCLQPLELLTLALTGSCRLLRRRHLPPPALPL
mmetsp:Transcript_21635/g.67783  ORF Transcript_21635/g.67783 Transcript_21635/m.67783 type:complete len:268 (+) Transcript_21635:749-1552(+)